MLTDELSQLYRALRRFVELITSGEIKLVVTPKRAVSGDTSWEVTCKDVPESVKGPGICFASNKDANEEGT
jgi:hypothetical protein